MQHKTYPRWMALVLTVTLCAAALGGCTAQTSNPPSIEADSVSVYYGFSNYALFCSYEEPVQQLVELYNGLRFEPSDADMDLGTMLTVVYSRDGKRVAELSADSNGVFQLDGELDSLRETTGTFDYALVKAIYDDPQNQDGQRPEAPDGDPAADIVITAPVYDPAAFMAPEEFVTARGVRLTMTYEEALPLIGEPEQTFDNAPGVMTVVKDGMHYGFYQIDDSFAAGYPLPRDGSYYLLDFATAAADYPYPLPRDLRPGDDIAAVLERFPAQDKTLKEWAMQTIYGQQGPGHPRAFLTYAITTASYRLCVVADHQVMNVYFDPQNRVEKIEFMFEHDA